MNNIQSSSAVVLFQNYKLISNIIRILVEDQIFATLEIRLSVGLYTCSSKVKLQKNVNIVKDFAKIADLKHESKLWKISGDICVYYYTPAAA